MSFKRHKVFISYFHKDDQFYKDTLVNKMFFDSESFQWKSIFDDYSVGDGDIDDENMSSEQIRVKIRDEFIKDATVLILLCGQNTRFRKHVDWEIHAAMYDTEKNPKMGIVVINLPTIQQSVRVSDDEEKPLVAPNCTNWSRLITRESFEKIYPYMPSRIIDNFVRQVPITVVDWYRIESHPDVLMELIDNAYKRGKEVIYDNSRPMRKKNG